MKKNFTFIATFVIGFIAGIFLVSLLSFDEKHDSAIPCGTQSTSNQPVWAAPALPASIDFAGEAVPLDQLEIKEALDREVLYNYYNQNSILYLLKLANRYFPAIEQRLKANGVPDDFKYLCVAESQLANAISRVGATGFWQFMKGTAPMFDIEVSSTVDERYHVGKSTDAACRYLKQAYAKFGSWTAAAASYNCGMGGYNDHSTFQQTKNYYDLMLPEETQRYIFRILAFKYLLSNADKLGFSLPATERYHPVRTRTITISNSISNLAAFARQNGTTYKLLKWYNPWLRARSLTVRAGKSYEIVLPAE
jgi:membrane-bound lytic murein transglycosylase D